MTQRIKLGSGQIVMDGLIVMQNYVVLLLFKELRGRGVGRSVVVG